MAIKQFLTSQATEKKEDDRGHLLKHDLELEMVTTGFKCSWGKMEATSPDRTV